MATNAYLTAKLASVFMQAPYYDGYHDSMLGYYQAIENPIIPDQINNGLANYTRLSCYWDAYDGNGNSSGSTTYFTNWYTSHHYTERPWNAYYARQTFNVNELYRFGYVSATSGGLYGNTGEYDFNQPKATADYEPIYGHASAWASGADMNTQFRNAAALPQDGTSNITSNNSNYNRDWYKPSCVYFMHIVNSGTVGSGNAKFIVEARPTYYQYANGGMNSPFWSSQYDTTWQFKQSSLNVEALNVMLGRIYDPANTQYLNPYNTTLESLYSARIVAAYPQFVTPDHRVREHATVQINGEYYAMAHNNYLAVFSNKSSVIPLQFFDFNSIWPSASHPRIGGIGVNGLDLYVISESGEFVRLSGSTITLLAPAPSLPPERRYSALAISNGVLYALHGDYASDFYDSNTSHSVGIVAFDLGSGTWGSLINSPEANVRINGKSFREMISFSQKLHILAENVMPPGNSLFDLSAWVSTKGVNTSGDFNNSTIMQKVAGSSLNLKGKSSWPSFAVRITTRSAATISKAFVKRALAGTTNFLDSTPITYGGLTSFSLAANNTLFSDDINIALDPLYDYYIVWYSATSNVTYQYTGLPSYYTGGDATAVTSVPSDWITNNTGYGLTDIKSPAAGLDYNGYNVGYAYNRLDWKWLIYDLNTSSWTALADPKLSWNLSQTSGYTSSAGFFILGNRVVAMSSPWSSGLLSYDGTALVSFGYGGSRNLFGFASDKLISIASDGVKGIVANNTDMTNKNPYGYQIYYFNDTFDWATANATLYQPNAKSNGIVTSSFTKNCYTQGFLLGTSAGTDVSSAANIQWGFLTLFNDSYFTHFHHFAGYGPYDPSYGYTTGIFSWFTQSTNFLPCYYGWNGSAWVRKDTFELAAASPRTIPAGQVDVPIVDGLVLQFGVSDSSTFQAGEYHTFNVCYGNVKYARKMTYNWSMFAGQTFTNTETKSMADVRAIRRKPCSLVNWVYTASGPSGLVRQTNNSWRFPKVVGGVPNDSPITTDYVVFDSDWATSDLVYTPHATKTNTQGSQVASASSQYNTDYVPGGAFDSDSSSRWASSNISTTGGVFSSPPWLQLDLGAGVQKIVKNYRIVTSSVPYNETPNSWVLAGSNDGTNFITLDSRVGINSQIDGWFSVATPGAYRYYRITISKNQTSGHTTGMSQLGLYSSDIGSVNFSEIQMGGDNTNARGVSFYVDKGSGYVQIQPIGRSNYGNYWYFDRQEAVQKIRVVFQQGCNYDATYGTVPTIYPRDYGTQAQMNAARLGSSSAANGTPARGSYDIDCLGIAVETAIITIDGVFDPLLTYAFSDAWSWNNSASYTGVVPTNKFFLHPYWGFIFFEGASQDGYSTRPGTNVTITYQWGRRA